MVYNADGSGGRPFAKGLRNAIGLDFDPKTGVLWANDMGQDGLGDDFPPDEINRVEDGKHFGFPYWVGNNKPNTLLTDAKGSLDVAKATPPAFEIPPHSSPIDQRFYTGKAFPARLRGEDGGDLVGHAGVIGEDRGAMLLCGVRRHGGFLRWRRGPAA